jgi:hypothetical protein
MQPVVALDEARIAREFAEARDAAARDFPTDPMEPRIAANMAKLAYLPSSSFYS